VRIFRSLYNTQSEFVEVRLSIADARVNLRPFARLKAGATPAAGIRSK
jgi:hypothetical protein